MAIPTDEDVHAALNSVPEFSGKVFPVVQAVDEDKEIDLPSVIYIPAGTEYDNYLDGKPDQVSVTYRCLVFDKFRKELPAHEARVLAALSARFNLIDFRALEDSFVDEDGGAYLRTMQFIIGR